MSNYMNMKKTSVSLIAFAGLIIFLWFGLSRKMSPEVDKVPKSVPSLAPAPHLPPQISTSATKPVEEIVPDTDLSWLKELSAGLVISQSFDPIANEPRGTVTSGNLVIDLGETPPLYRHQIQTATCPVMLGEKHERKAFHIYATSLLIDKDGATKEYPLSVSYPKWPGSNAGLETSGGFVFRRDEQPLRSIGVIVPKVIPEVGETLDMLDWQIQIFADNPMLNVDFLSKAKPQSLGSAVVVLMATHPDRISANSNVVWFKFEANGTVSLMEN